MLSFLAGMALLAISSPETAYAQSLQMATFPISEYATTTGGLIAHYASEFDVSEEEMAQTVQCESQGNERAWNRSDPHGGAKGIAQFLQPTFNTWSKRAGVKNGDVWDKEDAIKTMAYMFSVGEAKQWTCWHE